MRKTLSHIRLGWSYVETWAAGQVCKEQKAAELFELPGNKRRSRQAPRLN